MIPGFEKLVEERIREGQRRGLFDELDGRGRPLDLDDNHNVPEDLRIAYKMLKNADCLPPEIELRRDIQRTEDLLAGMAETAEKFRVMKKLNLMIMRLNALRRGGPEMDVPQRYAPQLVARFGRGRPHGGSHG